MCFAVYNGFLLSPNKCPKILAAFFQKSRSLPPGPGR